MATSNNTQQPQPGPIAQQLTKLQSNGHQVSSPQPSGKRPPVKKDKWGLADKTFWDVMHLLIVPFVLAIVTFGFGLEQSHISDVNSQKQHDTDLQIALDQQRETTLNTYLDDLKDLLLNRGLKTSKADDEVRVFARTQTLATLRQLDGKRKGIVIRFLLDAGLITDNNGRIPGDVIISLENADLSNADMFGIHLVGADLANADLSNANLSVASFIRSDLNGDNLEGVQIGLTYFDGSEMSVVNLKGVDLRSSSMRNTDLGATDLEGADLSLTDLTGADLSYANLAGANISSSQLAQAKSLKGATMPDGSIHP